MFSSLKRYLKSLSFRFVLVLALFGIVPGFVLRFAVLHEYEDYAVTQRMEEISDSMEELADSYAVADILTDSNTDLEEVSNELDELAEFFEVRFILTDDSMLIIKDTAQQTEGEYETSEIVTLAFTDLHNEESVSLKKGTFEIAVPVMAEYDSAAQGVLYCASTTAFIEDTLQMLRQLFSFLQFFLIIVVVICGYFVSAQLTEPLQRLSFDIRGLKQGHDVDVSKNSTYSETEMIAEACNENLDRMRALDNNIEEFVANVSHELKTPLASMKVLSDSIVDQEDVPNEVYREFMRDIAGEVDRENKIINDLLSIVRLGKGLQPGDIKVTNINDMLVLLMKRLRPIAHKQDVDLRMESSAAVMAEVDESKLTLAFSNLIENAIKYNRPDGSVLLTLEADHAYFYVKVMDDGIGIPQDKLDHIFERFYRVDKSHSRKIGGTGLGLAIVKEIVLMHKGKIRVHSVPGEGSAFAVRIPLLYDEEA